jgi:hypothetical protein
MVNATFICPSPLVYAYDNHDTVIWVFEPGHCASPCPTITYTVDEWDFLKQAVFTLAIISLVTTSMTLTILSADFSKLFLRAMFILGFLVAAIVSVVFLAQNSDDDVVCSGDGHFVKRAPLCIFQAIVIIFVLLWVEIWSVILSVDTYMHIVSRTSMERMAYWRKRYMGIALAFCTIFTSIPVIGGNVGFDPYANIPFCLYLFSENKWYFWSTLFVPFIALNSVCLIITILGAKRIHQIFVTTSKYTVKDSSASHSSRSVSRTKQFTSSSGPRDHSSHGETQDPSTLQSTGRKRYGDDPEDNDEESDYGDDGSSVDSHDLNDTYRSQLPAAMLSLNPALYNGNIVDKEFESPNTSVDYVGSPNLFPKSVPKEQTQNPLNAPLTPDQFGQLDDWRDSESKWIRSYNESSFQGQRPGAILTIPHTISNSAPSEIFSLTSGTRSPFSERTVSRDTESTWAGNLGQSLKKSGVTMNLTLLKEGLKYNGRSILFVIVFCATTLYVAPSLLYINGVKYNDYIDGSEQFAECLIEAAIHCLDRTQKGVDQCAAEQCGKFPGEKVGNRAGKLQFFSTMLWMFGYGIIPSFIFGFSSTLIRKFLDKTNTTLDSFVSTKSPSSSTDPSTVK